jgi:type I restriction enzyme S subunit
VLPPAAIRDAFAKVAGPMFALASANHHESAKLAELRDYLLPKLLSGAVRVRDAERVAAAVT